MKEYFVFPVVIICLVLIIWSFYKRHKYESHLEVGERIFLYVTLALFALSFVDRSGWFQNLAVESAGVLLVIFVLEREFTRRAREEKAKLQNAAFNSLHLPLFSHISQLSNYLLTGPGQTPIDKKDLFDKLGALDPNSMFGIKDIQFDSLTRSLKRLMAAIEHLTSTFLSSLDQAHIDLLIRIYTLGRIFSDDIEERQKIQMKNYELYVLLLSQLSELFDRYANEGPLDISVIQDFLDERQDVS